MKSASLDETCLIVGDPPIGIEGCWDDFICPLFGLGNEPQSGYSGEMLIHFDQTAMLVTRNLG